MLATIKSTAEQNDGRRICRSCAKVGNDEFVGGFTVGEQITIFDWMPQLEPEPKVGTIVKKTGAVIPHIMQKSYIGKKVCFDISTQSMRAYRVGILEKLLPDHYYKWDGKQYIETPCVRAVIYTGIRQRSFMSLYDGGRQLYEVLPWNAYAERMKAIFGDDTEVNA